MTLRLYAIIDAKPTYSLGRGIAGAPLALVRVAGAWAVVEPTEEVPAAPTIPSLLAHDRVVRRIARPAAKSGPFVSAVLPLRFGSTVDDRAGLSKLLAPLAEPIAVALDRVRGAVQFTLRVTGQPTPPPKLPRSAGPGTRFLTARVLARRVPEIDPLTEATRPFVRELRVERHERPPLLASVYHLVAREDVRRWRAVTRRTLDDLDVQVTTSGPWPAYAFAELE